MRLAIVIASLALALAACSSSKSNATNTVGGAAGSTPAVAGTTAPATKAADVATATAVPPTATMAPTATPKPTNTPAPTVTPEPTATPTEVPPTPTATPAPEPKVYDGSGDSVVDIQKPDSSTPAAIAYITGNADSRFFAVIGFNATGTQTSLLVNTTDPYEGSVTLDFAQGDATTRLQVKSSGDWRIELRPIASARVVSAPGTATGSGDDVFIVSGTVDTARITGNSDSRFFAVLGYGKNRNLLVNTTDPYDGTVVVAKDTQVIEVKAAGDWTITFK